MRAKVIEGRDCFQDHTCYEDIPAATVMFDQGNTSDFGHGVATGHFKLWTAEDLGANPNGLESACPISLRTFTSSGFIAIYQAPTPPPPPLAPLPPAACLLLPPRLRPPAPPLPCSRPSSHHLAPLSAPHRASPPSPVTAALLQ